QVIGILSHDLRNPIGAVRGIGGLALMDDALPATARTHFEQIGRAVSRMAEMIDRLLDYTQTRFAGQLPISPAPTDLCDVCRRVVEELRAGQPNCTIDLSTKGDTSGQWDAARIAQVVSNLLGNALTHGDPRAPVRLSIEGDREDVRVQVHNKGPA